MMIAFKMLCWQSTVIGNSRVLRRNFANFMTTECFPNWRKIVHVATEDTKLKKGKQDLMKRGLILGADTMEDPAENGQVELEGREGDPRVVHMRPMTNQLKAILTLILRVIEKAA